MAEKIYDMAFTDQEKTVPRTSRSTSSASPRSTSITWRRRRGWGRSSRSTSRELRRHLVRRQHLDDHGHDPGRDDLRSRGDRRDGRGTAADAPDPGRGADDHTDGDEMTNAIATAIGNGWLAWESSIKVPGLPWYPLFAAFPGPIAPPMPNVPTPLFPHWSPWMRPSHRGPQGVMMGTLGDPTALHAADLFDAVSQAFNTVFTLYNDHDAIVKNVLGTGPIPTFAPPFACHLGPVVGGVGSGLPGCFT